MKFDAEESYDQTVRRLVRHWLQRANGFAKRASQGDVNAVHDMRTSMRRVRTLLGLIKSDSAKRLHRKAKRYADRLGAVRDLDVALSHIHQSIQRGELFEGDGVRHWLEALGEERTQALRSLRQALRSRAYGTWKRRTKHWTRRESSGLKVHEGLPAALRELLQDSETLKSPKDETETHGLRKSLKRLRYVLEFYEKLLPPESIDVARRLTEAQDALGEHRDRIVLSNRAIQEAEAIDTMGEDPREIRAYARRLIEDARGGQALRTATSALETAHRLIAPLPSIHP